MYSETTRPTLWWKIDVSRFKVRKDTEQGICLICGRKKEWCHIL
jgi:hypothetical protein